MWTQLCRDTAPCAQAGLAVAVLGDMVNVMYLLLLSPRRAPCLKVRCSIALGFQRTGLSLYLVILIAVVCGAVVFLVISLIMCIRKPKDSE